MLRLNAAAFHNIAQELVILSWDALSGDEATNSEKLQADLLKALRLIAENCKAYGLDDTAALAEAVAERHATTAPSPDSVNTIVSDLNHLLRRELSTQWFVQIPQANAAYLDQATLFGKEVADVFPGASRDIREAGNCFACGLGTAAVFHLMRVAEHGLRALARKEKIKLGKSVEWAGWRSMINAIHDKVEARRQKNKRGAKREADLEYYSGVLGEFAAFQDKYRDQVMHSRTTYDQLQAASAMQHVREFMQRLAPRIAPAKREKTLKEKIGEHLQATSLSQAYMGTYHYGKLLGGEPSPSTLNFADYLSTLIPAELRRPETPTEPATQPPASEHAPKEQKP